MPEEAATAGAMGSSRLLEAATPVRNAVSILGRIGTADLRVRLAEWPAELDATTIHETRVCLRRLRSLLTVFRAALPEGDGRAVSAALGAMAGALGPVREWDVLRAETLAPLRRALDSDHAAATLIEDLNAAVDRARSASAIQARAAFDPQQTVPVLLALGERFDAGVRSAAETADPSDIDQPISDFARRLLASRHRRLHRDSKHALKLTPGELHGLRIDAKKQRYAIEFLSPLFPGRGIERYLEALKSLQTLLGTLNDAITARRRVAEAACGLNHAERIEGLVIGWTAAQIATSLRQLPDQIDHLAACKHFWKDG